MLSKSALFAGLVSLMSVVLLSNALECYLCSYLDGDSDTSCVNNASAVRVHNCTKKYCLTVRHELRRNSSKVMSFLRDCQDEPLINHGNFPDESSRFYYTSCRQNLCNGHNGRINNSTGGSGGSGIHNGIIPGKHSGATKRVFSWVYVFLIVAILLFIFK
ncbi:hypothetical protein KR009_001402 [Drosophila setifemur]|nr:hypothetical protein KR009_001402 [Drosophila setifemur]